MQQTQKYKLNLIETSDTFSPAPLNENTQMLEDIVAAGDDAEAKTRADADAALDQRVTVLEAHKISTGRYFGDGSTQIISLGFTPQAVIASPGNNFPAIAVAGDTASGLSIVDGGFQVTGTYLNYNNGRYEYFAIC